MKTFELKFSDPALGDVMMGRETYDQQVRPKVNSQILNGELVIRFPEHITIIGDSFIRGFARPLIDVIGLDGVRSRVHFVTLRDRLTKELYVGLV
ncbi:hypothetical protein LQZ24_04740 [Fructobacillus sp. M1-13]|uniref:DUF4325 domain-containing protein n=1 Tax=Fructobacillus papyriferae TaxID=2713171 RepID=A0ABS5QQW0_9LACO|nr:hypothetical protein [Fructobacillus papyriferae]MBS9335583.1 hypothetical protein [Fructobacillus papyriferae]MCD2159327.1 hypothetical protein [Fructobacillus papyriferae]